MLLDPLFFDPATSLLAIISGIVVGMVLGLTGGGGSVLAVPLLIYVVGIKDPHTAIGTAALCVGVTALISLIGHKKHGHLRLKEGFIFAMPGLVGTVIGAELGLLTPSRHLLMFFAIFMAMMGIRMYLQKSEKIHIHQDRIFLQKHRLIPISFLVGIAAGYFGIGGGFLVVPALTSLGLNITDAIGTSLLPVGAFGLATASRYFIADQIVWIMAAFFVGGGVLGGLTGAKFAARIDKSILHKIFGMMLVILSAYMLLRTLMQ